MNDTKQIEKWFKVKEDWRIVGLDNGEKLSLHDVTQIDISGNYECMTCKEGYVIVPKDRIVFIHIPNKSKVDS